MYTRGSCYGVSNPTYFDNVQHIITYSRSGAYRTLGSTPIYVGILVQILPSSYSICNFFYFSSIPTEQNLNIVII